MPRALAASLLLAAAASAQPIVVAGDPGAGGAPDAVTAASPVWAAHPSGLVWPLARPLGDHTFLSNYVDDAPASGVVIDYMGGRTHLYDGHRGTDVALANFRVMDRGVAVLAAAPGVVQSTTYGFGDRNTDTPYPDGGNGLSILHDDGSRAFYWHIRTNSAVVEPGERVEAGRRLAYVGSSGWTPIPHLHFELSEARDPWEGAYHTAPSLWAEQPAYVGDAPIWMMDADVFTPAATGGSIAGLTSRRLKERLSAPAVVGAGEGALYVWTQIQANAGDRYTLELRDPAGEVRHRDGVSVAGKTRYGWYAHALRLPSGAPHGAWTVAFLSDGRPLREVAFGVGDATEYGPRVSLPSSAVQQHVAGHAFRLDGAAQSLTLGVVGGPVTYALDDAPAYASLDGATLRIAAGADQPFRERPFRVLATDAAGRSDTLFVLAVHPGRPPESQPTAADDAPDAGALGLRVAPNPTRGRASVAVDLAAPGALRVVLLDALGREVAVLADGDRPAGRHALRLGAGLGAGVYAVRAAAGAAGATRTVTVVR